MVKYAPAVTSTCPAEVVLQELRCACGKLLAKVAASNVAEIVIQIKCPRCGIMYS